MLTTSSGPHYHQVQDQDQDEQRLEMRRISTLRYVFNKNPLYTILMLLLVTYYLTKEQAGIRETSAGPEHATGNAAMTKTSPNDARRVVWARSRHCRPPWAPYVVPIPLNRRLCRYRASGCGGSGAVVIVICSERWLGALRCEVTKTHHVIHWGITWCVTVMCNNKK